MAKASKQAPRAAGSSGKPVLTKRYRSIAEIKRDLFPNAAAEEAEGAQGSRGYENLLDEFFGPRQHAAS
jgi:hypothetical protein